jgi:DNA gyrase subunit B
MQPLITGGHIYIAQPPLYKISQSKKEHYAYDDNERDITVGRFKRENKAQKVHIQRYKGLGEMNPDQLWITTMDPERRSLLQVTIEEGFRANETFSELMGTDVGSRRRFIEKNAKFVTNLDV